MTDFQRVSIQWRKLNDTDSVTAYETSDPTETAGKVLPFTTSSEWKPHFAVSKSIVRDGLIRTNRRSTVRTYSASPANSVELS